MIDKLQLDDFEISYSTEGEGRDILLLHGFPSNMFFWNNIKHELKKIARVTIVEQRGYPLSSTENSILTNFNIENLSSDIERLIDKLKLNNNLAIVGHDWGSIVAWSIASRGNVKINKLVSVCGGTEFPSSKVYNKLIFDKGKHYISTFQDPVHANSLIMKDLDLFFRSAYRITPKIDYNLLDLSLKNLFSSYNSDSKLHDVNIESLINHFKGGLKQAISWYSNIDLNLEISSKWRKKLDLEITFLFGQLDAAVKLNDKMFDRLKNSGTNITIKEVKNADHWLPLTHKESIIDEFSNT